MRSVGRKGEIPAHGILLGGFAPYGGNIYTPGQCFSNLSVLQNQLEGSTEPRWLAPAPRVFDSGLGWGCEFASLPSSQVRLSLLAQAGAILGGTSA